MMILENGEFMKISFFKKVISRFLLFYRLEMRFYFFLGGEKWIFEDEMVKIIESVSTAAADSIHTILYF